MSNKFYATFSSAAALLVYDITDKDSFERVKSWVKELRKMAKKDIVLAIAGNKIDLDRQEQLDLTEQIEWALKTS